MIGIETGDPRDFETFDELFDAYKKQVKYFEDVKVNGSNINTQLTAKYNPVPYMSLLTEDCIARGEDYNAGGARISRAWASGPSRTPSPRSSTTSTTRSALPWTGCSKLSIITSRARSTS